MVFIMNKIQELIQQYAETNDNQFMLKIIELLQQRELIWTAYSPVTKNHYIEFQNGIPTAYVFSEIDFCNAFKDYLSNMKIRIEPMECDKEARASLFSDFFRNGIEQVIVDNGQMFVVIALKEIIHKPDFSAIPENKRPVMNPHLMRSANFFLQCQQTGQRNPQAQNSFMRDIYHAKYLLPIVMEDQAPKGTVIREMTFGDVTLKIAVLSRSDGQSYIPVFTDWIEFSKVDREMVTVGNVITFSDMEKLCENGDKLTINPLGFNMLLDKTTVQSIKSKFTAPEEQNKNEQIGFFALGNVPQDMLSTLTTLLDQTEGIHNAYLKGMRQNGKSSYVCIVDFSGTNPAVFQQIAQQVGPLCGGSAFHFVDYHSEIGITAAENTMPFYQRMNMK